MKTRPLDRRASRAGLATVVVLVLLFLVFAFIAGNALVLRNLKRELRRVEHVQQLKYLPPATTAPKGQAVSR
jgi:cell division protein FtsB